MAWYDRFLAIYERPFSEVPAETVTATRQRMDALQDEDLVALQFEFLAVELDTLERITFALYGDVELAAIGQAEGVLGQQWEAEQIVVGTGIGIKTHHVERQP